MEDVYSDWASIILSDERSKKKRQLRGRKKGFIGGTTKKISLNLVSDTDAPEHQPFKLSQNLHQTNFMTLTAVGLKPKFQKRREKLIMFGKIQ